MNSNDLLTTAQVAEMLDKSVNTIYKYVKEKKLRPVYEDSWQIDQTLLFKREDVEELREKLKMPGLTTGQVAKKLNLHVTTVNSYIKRGILQAEKHFHIGLGKHVYFVKEEEIENFKVHQDRFHDAKQFYQRDGSFFLFQSLHHPDKNEWGRIIDLTNEGKVMMDQGRTLSLPQAQEEGFVPKYTITEHPIIHQKGYCKFEFPKPQHISSPIYNVIDLFYQAYGRKNIRMTLMNDKIQLEVKPKFIEVDPVQYHMEWELLNKHLKDGKLLKRHNGFYIDSDLEAIVVHVRTEVKNQIKEQAELSGLTMDEFIGRLIKGYLSNSTSI